MDKIKCSKQKCQQVINRMFDLKKKPLIKEHLLLSSNSIPFYFCSIFIFESMVLMTPCYMTRSRMFGGNNIVPEAGYIMVYYGTAGSEQYHVM